MNISNGVWAWPRNIGVRILESVSAAWRRWVVPEDKSYFGNVSRVWCYLRKHICRVQMLLQQTSPEYNCSFRRHFQSTSVTFPCIVRFTASATIRPCGCPSLTARTKSHGAFFLQGCALSAFWCAQGDVQRTLLVSFTQHAVPETRCAVV